MSSGDSRSRTHTPAVPLARLQEYAGKVNSNDYDAEAASEDEDYKLRLNVSEKSLRDQVKRHEIAIEKVWVACQGYVHFVKFSLAPSD